MYMCFSTFRFHCVRLCVFLRLDCSCPHPHYGAGRGENLGKRCTNRMRRRPSDVLSIIWRRVRVLRSLWIGTSMSIRRRQYRTTTAAGSATAGACWTRAAACAGAGACWTRAAACAGAGACWTRAGAGAGNSKPEALVY